MSWSNTICPIRTHTLPRTRHTICPPVSVTQITMALDSKKNAHLEFKILVVKADCLEPGTGSGKDRSVTQREPALVCGWRLSLCDKTTL